MFIRNAIVTAGMLLGLVAGSAQAATYTGLVGAYFTQDSGGGQIYTFVNIGPGSAICYYVGTNTALASIFKTSQATGKPVTINCNASNLITQVSN